MDIKPDEIPALRVAQAIANNADKRLLFLLGGGIGDRVCAEPVIRYAAEKFQGVKISAVCTTPELIRHLESKGVRIYASTTQIAPGSVLPLYTHQVGLMNQFFSSNLMHTIDYTSLATLRCLLPEDRKSIVMTPNTPTNPIYRKMFRNSDYVLLHLGRSWPSRTFPCDWWDNVIFEIKRRGRIPVLIGCNSIDLISDNNITVDLRGKTSLNDLIWLCMNSYALITNDSSPIHLAAPGTSRVAFVATVRNPEFLLHYRGPDDRRGWRMKDFSKAPMWEMFDTCPNHLNPIDITQVPNGLSIREFLPDPRVIVDWICEASPQNRYMNNAE